MWPSLSAKEINTAIDQHRVRYEYERKMLKIENNFKKQSKGLLSYICIRRQRDAPHETTESNKPTTIN